MQDQPLAGPVSTGPSAPKRRRRPRHPILVSHEEERQLRFHNRIADLITAWVGSMSFVYIHLIWFVIWIFCEPFRDVFPYGLLTMIVSLEAIFLTTFVMISQNRADEKRQALADHQWEMIQLEEQQNRQIIDISQQVLRLTVDVHALTLEAFKLLSTRQGDTVQESPEAKTRL